MYRKLRTALALAATIFLLAACKDQNASVGLEISPTQDQIIIAADTFYLESADQLPHSAPDSRIAPPVISAQTDSFVLGEFYSPKYGTTKAEILVQLAAPEGYTFPSAEHNPTPDSLALLVYYKTWFGSPYAPIELSVFELNKELIDYNSFYRSDIDPMDFTDTANLMGKRLVTSIDVSRLDSTGKDTAATPYIRYKFDDYQLNRFFNIAKSGDWTTTDDFLRKFKGMYLTTRYGTSTIIYPNQISLYLYYHYTYKRNGRDTVVNTSIIFPANKEVRQLHRLSHPDIEAVATHSDSVNYIKSAGGIYPKITIPIGQIDERMKARLGDKSFNINAARVKMEVVDDSEEKYVNPPAYLLALTSEQYEDFIMRNTIPATLDSTSILVQYNPASNSYEMNLNYLLTARLRNRHLDPASRADEKIDLTLVPVSVIMQTNGTISKIKPLAQMAAATIRSGKNSRSPMKLELLYNGF